MPDQRQAARVHGATGRKVRRKERRRRQHKPRPGASWRGQADAHLCSPHLGPGARTAVFTGRINERVFAEQMKSGRALGDPWQHGCQSGPCPVLSPLPPGASPLACFSQDLSHGTKTGKGAIFPELSPQATAPAAGYPATASHPCPSRPLLRACPPFCGREGGRPVSVRAFQQPGAAGVGPARYQPAASAALEGQTCSGGRHVSWPRGSSQAGGWAPRAAGHSSLSGPRAPKLRGSRERAHSPADRPWRCGPLLFWLQPGLLSSPSPPRAFAPGHRLQRDHPALPKRTPRHRMSHDPPEGETEAARV